MEIQEIIQKAVAGGYDDDLGVNTLRYNEYEDYEIMSTLRGYVIDPDFWRAVGKSMGWKDNITSKDPEFSTMKGEEFEAQRPKTKMLNMIHALWEGATIEEYLKIL